MDDIKRAAALAREFLLSITDDASSVRVEEVEPPDEGPGWLITLSFLSAPDHPLGQFSPQRISKRFYVTDAGVQPMTIRELESA